MNHIILKLKPLTFSRTKLDFSSTLNKRVSDYFKSNGITRHGNSEMVIKTVCMFLLYLVPYVLIVTNLVTGPLFLILLILVMSFGLGGIGLSVMHDANHGAYSKKAWLNSIIGYSLNFVGANSYNWKRLSQKGSLFVLKKAILSFKIKAKRLS